MVVTALLAVLVIAGSAIPVDAATSARSDQPNIVDDSTPVSVQTYSYPCGPFSYNDVQIGHWPSPDASTSCTAVNGSGFVNIRLPHSEHMCSGVWSGTIFYTDPSQPWADLLYFDFSSGACFDYPPIDIWGVSIK
jgi:hypothetical protein